MQEELSVRVIIKELLRAKTVIIGVTIIAGLIAGLLSYYVIKPTYETKATVMVNSLGQQEENSLSLYLKEVISPRVYSERLYSHELLSRLLEKEELKGWNSVQSLKNGLAVSSEGDSNIIRLTVKGQDPELIYKTLDNLLIEANHYLNDKISIRLNELASQYKQQLDIEKENLEAAIMEFNEAAASSGIPAIVLLDALNSGENEKQFILDVDQAYLDELKTLDKDKQVEFEKLNTRVDTLTELYNQYYGKYEEARSMAKLYNVGNNVSILTIPEIPSGPVSPNIKLNIIMASIIGFMISVISVLFKYYWKASAKDS
jgi:capsular polysaccharide biosynthesis protein